MTIPPATFVDAGAIALTLMLRTIGGVFCGRYAMVTLSNEATRAGNFGAPLNVASIRTRTTIP